MIYFDHNATSPSSESHLKTLCELLPQCMGNPSSPHAVGRNASVALSKARRSVASAIGVDVAQIIFVSGGSEANNTAVMGALHYLGLEHAHAIASSIEHPAVLEPLEYLERKEDLTLSLDPANSHGFVNVKEIVEQINLQTKFITLMAANNEVGSIQPIKILGDFLHYKRWGLKPSAHADLVLDLEKSLSPLVTKEQLQKLHFHVDAVQAFGKIRPEDWMSPGIDSCAISGHKLGALPGVGVLFLRRGRQLNPLILGGAQEKNRRAGTENLPGVISLGLICDELLHESWWDKIAAMDLKRVQIQEFLNSLPVFALVNSPKLNVLPNTVNFSLNLVAHPGEKKRKNGEDLLLEMDLKGICASSGSACSSGANLPSKVLLAMNKTAEQAKNAIRISLSPSTTQLEIDELISFLKNFFSPSV
jgi:cysteine desulfurase